MLFPLKRERLLKLHHPVGPQARLWAAFQNGGRNFFAHGFQRGMGVGLVQLGMMSARLPTAGDFLQTVGAGNLVERDSQRQQVFGGTAYAFAR